MTATATVGWGFGYRFLFLHGLDDANDKRGQMQGKKAKSGIHIIGGSSVMLNATFLYYYGYRTSVIDIGRIGRTIVASVAGCYNALIQVMAFDLRQCDNCPFFDPPCPEFNKWKNTSDMFSLINGCICEERNWQR